MGSPFTEPTISSYNDTPPSDDGSTATSNEITWAKHKTKLADPIKTLVETVITNITTAFSRVWPYQIGSISSTYTLAASDRGKSLNCTGTFTLTLLAAATAADNFVVSIKNISTGTITIDGDGSETIDGATTLTLADQYESVTLLCDGSAWHVVARNSTITSQASIDYRMGYFNGGALSNGSDASHDIDVAAFEGRDSTNAENIVLSAITKQIDATWSSGTNAGGLSSSLTAPANNTWYHVFAVLIGGSADVIFDTSLTCVNGVSDHSVTEYRHIGSVLTDGSANILPFTQTGNSVVWTSGVNDYSATASRSDAVLSLTVPPYKVKAEVVALFKSAGVSQTTVDIYSPDSDGGTNNTFQMDPSHAGFENYAGSLITNTSGQIKLAVSHAVTSGEIDTLGWEYIREAM